MSETRLDRRAALMAAGLVAGALAPGVASASGPRQNETKLAAGTGQSQSREAGLVPDHAADQSKALQAAIDKAAERGVALTLPSGRFLARDVRLRPGSVITGTPGRTVLVQSGPGSLLTGDQAHGARICGLVLDGGGHPLTGSGPLGLLALTRSPGLALRDLEVRASQAHGIVVTACGGRIMDCAVTSVLGAGIFSVDAEGLEISHNHVADCANNGILVWRTVEGSDATIVANNRIERIRAAAGGTGQNGNGINVYRAGSVLVTGNRIVDCAYTAIRGNKASNIQMVANSCQRLGEVALYAEFGFEGALIASNVVDRAATGISVTNFNEGGRLAVVQGNLIRNLVRREHEPEDKRGEGIAVEADAVVTGNTIENAPTAGLVIGWGHYMRDVVATSNIIRQARVGIMITRDPGAGSAMIAQNMISGARDGAIRLMDKGIAIGPDLARTPSPSPRISVAGNMVVGAST